MKKIIILLCINLFIGQSIVYAQTGLILLGGRKIIEGLNKKADRNKALQELEQELTLSLNEADVDITDADIDRVNSLYSKLSATGYKKANTYLPKINQLKEKRQNGLNLLKKEQEEKAILLKKQEQENREKEKREQYEIYANLIAQILYAPEKECNSVLSQKKQIDDLKKQFDFTEPTQTQKDSLHLIYGRCYFQQQNYKEAFFYVDNIKHLLPSNELYNMLFVINLDFNNKANAILYLDSLMSISSPSIELKEKQYILLMETNAYEKAKTVLTDLLKLSKNTVSFSHFEFVAGNHYRHLGDLKTALSYYKSSILHGNQTAEVYNSAGLCAYNLKNTALAKTYFTKAYAIEGKNGISCDYLRELSYGIVEYESVTLCRDGSISYSSGRGTCSRHGGVAQWNYQRPVYGYKFECE